VTPVLTVADVRLAVAWYIEVFGFVEHVRIGEGTARNWACRTGRRQSWSWQRFVRDGEHRSGNDPTK
jgi:hypothetical protein